MMQGPLVTVGVASYNNSGYIAGTLKSIAAQTYRNIEVIVVDDRSGDDSVSVIRQHLSLFNVPVRLIGHEKNLGVVAVCNTVLQEAKGKYLCIVGSDDVFLPGKISEQVAVMERTGCDMVFSAVEYINSAGDRFEGATANPLPGKSGGFVITWQFLLGGSFITAPTVMLRTQLVRSFGGYDTSFSIEDMPLWVKLAKSGAGMYFLVDPLVKYRIHGSSLTSKLTTLISHARIVSKAAGSLSFADRCKVRMLMWHKIIALNDSKTRIAGVPPVELLYWLAWLNRSRLFHYLIYKLLNRIVSAPSFKKQIERIKLREVYEMSAAGMRSTHRFS